MILKKLTVKNFMSYSNTDIDLSGLHIACLIGPNGAGKSSLLDAITWILWEEGRAKTDELIKLGTNEMYCEIEFFMEDEFYRVYRSRTKGLRNSQGKSNLEFQIFNQKDNTWTSLSKSSVRQTQELITKTLRMDYEAFVNSVYLQQGKADEFTTRKPNERKQILSDILGLQIYDELSLLAHGKVRNIDQQVLLETRFIDELKTKIEAEEDIKNKHSEISEKVKRLEENYNKIKVSLHLKDKELNEKKHTLKQIGTMNQTKESQLSLLSSLESQLKNLENKHHECNKLISSKDEIENKYQKYVLCKEKIEMLERAQGAYSSLVEKKNKLEHLLNAKLQETEKEIAIYKSKINDKGTEKKQLEHKLQSEKNFHEDFLPDAERTVQKFYEMQEKLSVLEANGQELKYNNELLAAELKTLEVKRNEIRQKMQTLESHTNSESCPLCKGEIRDKAGVINAYNSELLQCEEDSRITKTKSGLNESQLKEKRAQYKTLLEEINTFGSKNLSSHIKKLEDIRQEKLIFNKTDSIESKKAISYLQSQIEVSKSEFQAAKLKITVIDQELIAYHKEYEQLQVLLKGGDAIKEITSKLTQVEKELKELNYNQTIHNELRQELRMHEGILIIYNSLQQADKEITSLKNEIVDLNLKIQSGKDDLAKLEKLIEESKLYVTNVDIIESEVQDLTKEENSKCAELEDGRKCFIMVERELADIDNCKKQFKEKESKIKETVKAKSNYEKLEKAFSKNGIQIAIIETVVPEIEKEANRILSRLTDNQMHVALRTQREKKSSTGLIETLDVIISDSVGTRSYELYSGGEAFKINFSLRLALSRLLANRAGARLQTLVIDEGFGSQDSAGRDRLVEVIRSIENEFELMLIVTHLDELKESFPAQLQVYKDEEGSHVELVA